MKTIISCDPGASGAIAWWHKVDVVNPVDVRPMPETRGDTIDLLKAIVKEAAHLGHGIIAYTEKITGYIPEGGASQMFEFGRSVERVGCILETLGVRIIEVTPQAWQKSLGLGVKGLMKVPSAPRGSSPKEKAQFKADYATEIKFAKDYNAKAKTDWKNKLKGEAQRRFPGVKITLKTCDALLILDYAMRSEGGGQVIVPGTGKDGSRFYVPTVQDPQDNLPFA